MFSKESSEHCQSRFYKEWHPDFIGSYNSLNDKHLKQYFQHPSRLNQLSKSHKVTPNGEVLSEREWRRQNLYWERRRREAEASLERQHQRQIDQRRATMELRQRQKDIDAQNKRAEQGEVKRTDKHRSIREAWADQSELLAKISESNRQDVEHLLDFLNFEIEYILRPRSAPTRNRALIPLPLFRAHHSTLRRRAQSARRAYQQSEPRSYKQVKQPGYPRVNGVRAKSLERAGLILAPENVMMHQQKSKMYSSTKRPIRNIEIPDREFSPSTPSPMTPNDQDASPVPPVLSSTRSRPRTVSAHRFRKHHERPRSPSHPNYKEEAYLLTQIELQFIGHSDQLQRQQRHRYRKRRRLPQKGQGQKDEVTIVQQPRGSYVLEVFHGFLSVGDKFTFTSRRVEGYPFSVTIYVNHVCHVRLSACCEAKRPIGSRLGLGSFQLVSVHDVSPCIRCLLERDPIAQKHNARIRRLQGTYDKYGNRRPPEVFRSLERASSAKTAERALLMHDTEDEEAPERLGNFKRDLRRRPRYRRPKVDTVSKSQPQNQMETKGHLEVSSQHKGKKTRPKSAPKYNKTSTDRRPVIIRDRAPEDNDEYSSLDEESSEADIVLPEGQDDDDVSSSSSTSESSSPEQANEALERKLDKKRRKSPVDRTLKKVEVKNKFEDSYRLGRDACDNLIGASCDEQEGKPPSDQEHQFEMEDKGGGDTIDDAPSIVDEDASMPSEKVSKSSESSSSSSEEEESTSESESDEEELEAENAKKKDEEKMEEGNKEKKEQQEDEKTGNDIATQIKESNSEGKMERPQTGNNAEQGHASPTEIPTDETAKFVEIDEEDKKSDGYEAENEKNFRKETPTSSKEESASSESMSSGTDLTESAEKCEKVKKCDEGGDEEQNNEKLQSTDMVKVLDEEDDQPKEEKRIKETESINDYGVEKADEKAAMEKKDADTSKDSSSFKESNLKVSEGEEGNLSQDLSTNGQQMKITASNVKKIVGVDKEFKRAVSEGREIQEILHENLLDDEQEQAFEDFKKERAKQISHFQALALMGKLFQGFVRSEKSFQACQEPLSETSEENQEHSHTEEEEEQDDDDYAISSSITSTEESSVTPTEELIDEDKSPIKIFVEKDNTESNVDPSETAEAPTNSNMLQVPQACADDNGNSAVNKEAESIEDKKFQQHPPRITHFQALILLQRLFTIKKREARMLEEAKGQEHDHSESDMYSCEITLVSSDSITDSKESDASASFSQENDSIDGNKRIVSADIHENSKGQCRTAPTPQECSITVQAVIEHDGNESEDIKRDATEAEGEKSSGEEETNSSTETSSSESYESISQKENQHERVTKSKDEEEACTKIQAGYRGMVARREVAELKKDQEMLQSKAEKIQAEEETVDSDDNESSSDESSSASSASIESSIVEATIKIQAGYRGMKARQQLNETKRHKSYEDEKEFQAIKQFSFDDEVYVQSAIKIQSGFRGMQVRKEVQQLKDNKPHERRFSFDEREAEKNAIAIQSGYRGMKARKKVKEMKENQSKDNLRTEHEENASELAMEREAVKIQAGFRGMQARRQVKEIKTENNLQEEQIVQKEVDESESSSTLQDSSSDSDSSEPLGSVSTLASINGISNQQIQSLVKEQQLAATKIQAGYKGMKVRKSMKQQTSKSNELKEDMESHQAQNYKEHKEYIEEKDDKHAAAAEDLAGIKIQAGYRGMKVRKTVKDLNKEKEESSSSDSESSESSDEDDELECFDNQDAAATKIQAGYRGMKARKTLKDSNEVEVKAETLNETKTYLKDEEAAATKIQAGYEGMKDRKILKDSKNKEAKADTFNETKDSLDDENLEGQERAATKIQAGYRGMKVRKNLKNSQKEEEESDSSSSDSESSESSPEDNDLDNQEAAATKIQAGYRGMKVRQTLKESNKEKEESDSSSTDSESSESSSEDDEMDDLENQEAAATRIQAGYRGMKVRKNLKISKKEEEDFYSSSSDSETSESSSEDDEMDDSDNQEAAATKIQAGYRGMKVRKTLKEAEASHNYESLERQEAAATRIQAGYRGMKVRKTLKEAEASHNYESLEGQEAAATRIQAGYRGMKVRKNLKNSQKEEEESDSSSSDSESSESSPEDNDLDNQEAAATKIQAGYRGMNVRKTLKESNKEKEESDSSSTVSESSETFSEDDKNDDLNNQEAAATKIQAGYRGMKVRKNTHKNISLDKSPSNDPYSSTILEDEDRTKELGATKIQAGYKGMKVRKTLKGNNVLDSLVENESASSVSDDLNSSKEVPASNSVRSLNYHEEEQNKLAEEAAATKIQAGYKGMKVRKSLKGDHNIPKETESSMKIVEDHNAFEYLKENEGKVKDDAATKIQAGYRGMKVRQDTSKNRQDDVNNSRNHDMHAGAVIFERFKDNETTLADNDGFNETAHASIAQEDESVAETSSSSSSVSSESDENAKNQKTNSEKGDEKAFEIINGIEEKECKGLQTGDESKIVPGEEIQVRPDSSSSSSDEDSQSSSEATEHISLAKKTSVDSTISTKAQVESTTHPGISENQDDQAVIKIQAGYRGMKARQEVRKMRNEKEMDRDVNDDENSDIDINDPEVTKAATLIQAGFLGMKRRRELEMKKMQSNTDEALQVNLSSEKEIDLSNPEVRKAASVIIAGFLGIKAKRNARRRLDEIAIQQQLIVSQENKFLIPQDETKNKDSSEYYSNAESISEKDTTNCFKIRKALSVFMVTCAVARLKLKVINTQKSNRASSDQSLIKKRELQSVPIIKIDLEDPQVKKAVAVLIAGFLGMKAKRQARQKLDLLRESLLETKLQEDIKDGKKIDMSDESVNEAVTQIQAGFCGMKARKDAKVRFENDLNSHHESKIKDIKESKDDTEDNSKIVNYDSINEFTEDSEEDSSSSDSEDHDLTSSKESEIENSTHVDNQPRVSSETVSTVETTAESNYVKDILLEDLMDSNHDNDSGTSMSNQETPRESEVDAFSVTPNVIQVAPKENPEEAKTSKQVLSQLNVPKEGIALEQTIEIKDDNLSDSGTCDGEDMHDMLNSTTSLNDQPKNHESSIDEETSDHSAITDSGTSSATEASSVKPIRRRKSPFLLIRRLVGIAHFPNKIRKHRVGVAGSDENASSAKPVTSAVKSLNLDSRSVSNSRSRSVSSRSSKDDDGDLVKSIEDEDLEEEDVEALSLSNLDNSGNEDVSVFN